MGLTTGFIDGSTGVDIGAPLVEKSYMIDRYGELDGTFKQAGLWLWGQNGFGQLGDNTNQSAAGKSSPVQTISGGLNWEFVSSGYYHNAVIKTDNSLWLWGAGTVGELGNNAQTSRSSPVQTVSGGTNWKQVSAGGNPIGGHTAAIKTDSSLWTWGLNNWGQLGNNAQGNRSSPVQTVSGGTNWKAVSAGGFHTAAIKTDGTLWLWGRNTVGQLGNDDTDRTTRSSPVQTVAGGTNWQQISCGDLHTAAIKTDGTLWLWGYNNDGQLGDNTNQSLDGKLSPVQTISGGTNWEHVSCGTSFTTATKTDGALWTWGNNTYGQLGDNTTISKSSPIQTISGGTNWKIVSPASTASYAIAMKTDGTLWLWGYNNDGQLGDNTITNKSSPVQTVSGGTNWKNISGGYSSALAVRDEEY